MRSIKGGSNPLEFGRLMLDRHGYINADQIPSDSTRPRSFGLHLAADGGSGGRSGPLLAIHPLVCALASKPTIIVHWHSRISFPLLE